MCGCENQSNNNFVKHIPLKFKHSLHNHFTHIWCLGGAIVATRFLIASTKLLNYEHLNEVFDKFVIHQNY